MKDIDIIICDLDGTLADITHRLHFIQNKKKDWPQFFEACVNDKPIYNTINVINTLAYNYEVYITSGRNDVVKEITQFWLLKHGITYHKLLMRKAGDYRPDSVVKLEWLVNGLIPKERILCAFDDRQRVVDMWRNEGITCYQVAEGNF
jgi:FMN phosphatase YigB (HAD superfamily)